EVALPAEDVGEIAERRRGRAAIAELATRLHAFPEPDAGALVVAHEAADHAQVVEEPDDAPQIAELAVDPERLLDTGRRFEHRREQRPERHRVGAGLGARRETGQLEDRLEARVALEAVLAAIPVVGQGERQPERPVAVAGADQVIERGAMIVVLALAAGQPGLALAGRE